MNELATGIILRTRPLTETSLIVQWLTASEGRIATVAKGARRPKSSFLGKLDLFYLADFSFLRSRRSELHTLREVILKETHAALRRDLLLLRQASYCTRLIEQTTESETPIPGVYELMRDLLSALAHPPHSASTVMAFELRLLQELGLAPNLEETRLSPGTLQVARALTIQEWPELRSIRPSAAQELELRQFLHGFLIYHLDRLPPGRDQALPVVPRSASKE